VQYNSRNSKKYDPEAEIVSLHEDKGSNPNYAFVSNKKYEVVLYVCSNIDCSNHSTYFNEDNTLFRQ